MINVLVYNSLCETLLLRDTVAKNFGCHTLPLRNGINCIVNYLATV